MLNDENEWSLFANEISLLVKWKKIEIGKLTFKIDRISSKPFLASLALWSCLSNSFIWNLLLWNSFETTLMLKYISNLASKSFLWESSVTHSMMEIYVDKTDFFFVPSLRNALK